MLYQQEKEERQKEQLRAKIAKEELEKQELENKKNMANIEENLDSADPWLASKPEAEPPAVEEVAEN